MYPASPYHVGTHGRTAHVSRETYIRQLIEQVLFTTPGERVNREDFGCGLLQLVFASPGSDVVVAAQSLIHGALQRWLGDIISVEAVQVISDDATLRIVIQYLVKESGQRQREQFEQGLS